MKTLKKCCPVPLTLSLYLEACGQERKVCFTSPLDQGPRAREETSYLIREPASYLLEAETKRFSASLQLSRLVCLAQFSYVERAKDELDESRNN